MIFFRADSNEIIASGHIMRCISIATFLKNKGCDVSFLIADENPVEMLEYAGITYQILHSKWNDLSHEIDKIHSIICKENNPILLIDTYSVNKEYVEEFLPYAKVGYIGSKQEYLGKLNFLINYSTDINDSFYNFNYSETKLLLGPSYAPLRKEFQNVLEHYNEPDFRILLTTGNTDPFNCVPLVIDKIINNENLEGSYIDVVVGKMFKNANNLLAKYKDKHNITLHQNVVSMSELMQKASLSISANGTTIYELAASHVPIISFSLVPEQVRSAESLTKLGIIQYAGEMFSNMEKCINNIIDHANRLKSYPQELELLGRKAHKIIDGKGCEKIYKELFEI